jgi:predicted Zn-dependent protease
MRVRACILLLFLPALRAQDSGANFYSLEKELALGAQLAAEYRRNVTPIDSPTVSAYLNEIGQRLVAASHGPAFPYRFELVDASPTLVNEPAAFPGGPIFVSAQLILAAKNEDEFAGMLAHSIAHIAARYGAKQATKEQIVNQASVPLIMMGGWSGYAIRQGQALAVPVGFLKFQRQIELQADRLAVQSMSAAGYNPASLADYVERVQPEDSMPPKSTNPLPDRASRVAEIRAAIQDLPAAAYPPHNGFAAIQAEVARLAAKPAKAPPSLAR